MDILFVYLIQFFQPLDLGLEFAHFALQGLYVDFCPSFFLALLFFVDDLSALRAMAGLPINFLITIVPSLNLFIIKLQIHKIVRLARDLSIAENRLTFLEQG